MDVDRLRSETRGEHEAVEALLPLMDEALTLERYAGILACLYRIVNGWEDWATTHAPPTLVETVRERRRSALLQGDLLAMNQEISYPVGFEPGWASDFPDRADAADFEAAFLGAMYVMEGSTLGGQFIARHVETTLGLAPGVGDAYFRSYGEGTASMWQRFKELLLALPDEHADIVIAAAKAMFRFYGEALRTCPAISFGVSLP